MANQDITMIPGWEGHDPEYYTNYDDVTQHLMDTLKIIAAYHCPNHNSTTLCSCPSALAPITPRLSQLLKALNFTIEWEQHLMEINAAYNLEDNVDSKASFTFSCGQTPEKFAGKFAKATFSAPAMTKAVHSMNDVVDAMLAFWFDRAAKWRAEYADMAAVRKAIGVCQPGDVGSELYGDMTGYNPRYGPQVGKRLVLQRMHVGLPQSGHLSTVYMMPLRATEVNGVGGVTYMCLGVRPCHEGCPVWRLRLTQEIWARMMGQLMGLV